MKYYIKEHFLSLRKKFDILDSDHKLEYKALSNLFPLRKKITIYDLEGREILHVEENFSILNSFTIYSEKGYLGDLYREISFLRPRYILETTRGDYRIESDYIRRSFKLFRGEELLGKIYKVFSLRDSYEIEIFDPSEKLLIIGLTITLDQIHYYNKAK